MGSDFTASYLTLRAQLPFIVMGVDRVSRKRNTSSGSLGKDVLPVSFEGSLGISYSTCGRGSPSNALRTANSSLRNRVLQKEVRGEGLAVAFRSLAPWEGKVQSKLSFLSCKKLAK